MGSGSTSNHKRDANGMSGDDGDNRTRNAKAQRRHREKRKAHLKGLEDKNSLLEAQVEEANRWLAQRGYPSSSSLGQPPSPQSKDYAQLQAENAYLRDENADLRRQVYGYRVNFGHLPPQPPGSEPNKQGRGWGDVKQEGAFGVTYGQSSMESPQRADSSSRGPPRQSGEVVGDAATSNAETSSAPSSTASYPPPIDHFTPINSRSRNRVMSSSSAPSQSPYLPSNSFQGPRYTADPNTAPGPSTGPHPVRYESMYPAPPPHNLPRSGPGLYEMQGHNHPYAPRPDGEGMPWVPESGPPPFQGSVPYPMGFPHDNQQGGEDWRQEH